MRRPEAARLFLLCEASEFIMQLMAGIEKRLLTMKDRGVVASRIIQAFELSCAKIELDAPDEHRVRIGLEVSVDEI